MRDDLDARIGEVFRRLSMMRLELGERALDRTIHDVLQTLGVAAHREAEYRASILAARDAARNARTGVSRIGPPRIDDGIFEGLDG